MAGETKINVSPSTHLRLQVADGKTVLSVLNGTAEVRKGAETTVVAKKQSLTLDGDQVIVAKKVAGEPYDAWERSRTNITSAIRLRIHLRAAGIRSV